MEGYDLSTATYSVLNYDSFSKSGLHPSALLDTTRASTPALAVTRINTPAGHLALFTCNVSAQVACVFSLLVDGNATGWYYPAAALRTWGAGRLIVAAQSGLLPAGLFSCDVRDAYAPHCNASNLEYLVAQSVEHSIALHAASERVFVSARAQSSFDHLVLYSCALVGEAALLRNCSVQDLSQTSTPQAPVGTGRSSTVIVDALRGRLLLTSQGDSGGNFVALFRCELYGAARCNYTSFASLVPTPPSPAGAFPVAAYDESSALLVIAALVLPTARTAALFRCDVLAPGEPPSCNYTDVAAVALPTVNTNSGLEANVALPLGRLALATQNLGLNGRLALFLEQEVV